MPTWSPHLPMRDYSLHYPVLDHEKSRPQSRGPEEE